MEYLDILKLFGAGGLTLVMFGGLMWLIRTIGLSVVQAMKDLREEVSEHTKADLAHHGEVKEELVRLAGKLEIAVDARWDELTPVGTVPPPRRERDRIVTPARGAPTSYAQHRKRTEDDR